MRDLAEILALLAQADKETARNELNGDNEDDPGVVGVSDALRWVTDPNLPVGWLDGYFKDRT